MHLNLRTPLDDGPWWQGAGKTRGVPALSGELPHALLIRVAAPREGSANGLTPVPVESEFLRQRTWNDLDFCHCQKLRLLYPAGDYCPGCSKRPAGDLSGPLIVRPCRRRRRRRLCFVPVVVVVVVCVYSRSNTFGTKMR